MLGEEEEDEFTVSRESFNMRPLDDVNKINEKSSKETSFPQQASPVSSYAGSPMRRWQPAREESSG